MAFRWRANDCPSLNAGLVCFENFRGSGPVLLRNSIFLWFFRGGSGPPVPPLDPRLGLDNVYTYWDILKTHFIVCIIFCTTLCILPITCTKIFKLTNNSSGLIWIQTDFANLKKERERDWYMHILLGKSKCIDRSTSRERERMCVLFEFRVYFAKKSDRRDVLEWLYYIINGIWADREQAKAFWFSEGRTKV